MSKVIVIAEAGVNHNGDLSIAKKLVDAAAAADSDYIKFQTFKADQLVSKSAKQAEYQKKNIGDGSDSQYEMLKKLELSHQNHVELVNYCKEKKISFFSTAFDLDSLEYLATLGFDLVKIPSGEITNLPYLEKAAELFEKVIISTGMSNMVEIKEALEVFLKAGKKRDDITILHCNTEYPTPFEDVNLKAMHDIAHECKVAFGYSDHTLGVEVPVAAVALGATVIEKHFTLSRSYEGPDHKASLEPEELKVMVKSIRNIEKAISGSGKKEVSNSEKKNLEVARKSIHIAKPLKAGTILSYQDLKMKRPGNGISPMQYKTIVGKELKVDLEVDTLLNFDHIK